MGPDDVRRRRLVDSFETTGRVGRVLPSGTVTFLFADIEGSTTLLQHLGGAYDDVLGGYRDVLRDALERHGGAEVDTEGDGLFAAFDSAREAVLAVVDVQRALASHIWPGGVQVRARAALHTGEATPGGNGYVGIDVHRAARIVATAHGGQVVVSQSTRAVADALEQVSFRDLGVHRLRDLTEPEHLYQLVATGLDEDFPPLRSLDAMPNNLPTQVTSFIGRGAEVDRALDLLSHTRLLTLTGPGGTGKTRLSLQVAACLTGAYRDGVWFVPLASVDAPQLVASAILDALRVREAADRTPAERVVQHLKDKHLLLVLDNFEQVLSAASLIGEILREAADVRILVTSRAALHVYGEQELPVPPLRLPDPTQATSVASLSQYEAVALFIQRCMAVKPDFEVTADNAPAIVEICARLDGLPLAIELAAARIKLLSPDAMLQRLERRLSILKGGSTDLPQRQQTLRDAIAWSYDLLDDTAKSVMRQLSVFVGGCTLEQAEAICVGGADVFDGLATLVDHSLVRQTDTEEGIRFSMLETIREFATAELDARGESATIRDRHAKVFLDLCEEAAPHLTGRSQRRWTARLEAEDGNCRAALEWFIERGEVVSAMTMIAAMWRFWQKNHVHEGRQRVDAVLALQGLESHPVELAGVYEAAGSLAYWAGDLDQLAELYGRALELQRTHGDTVGIANALYNMSFSHSVAGDELDKGMELLNESLELYRSIGDRAGMAKVRWGMGVANAFSDRDAEAEPHFREALDLARAVDDVFMVAWTQHMIGSMHVRHGDRDNAIPALAEALQLFADTGDVAAIAMMMDDFSALAELDGDAERQARLTAASKHLAQASGGELVDAAARLFGRTRARQDTFAKAWDEGLTMTADQAVAYAREVL